MKIFIAFVIMILLLSGCAAVAYGDEKTPDDRLKIITTAFPLYDFTRNIAGDKMQVAMLFPLGADKHTYEPTPHDIIKIKESGLLIYVGGASDNWAGKISENSLKLADSVLLFGDNSCSHNRRHLNFDEHIWTSPKNAILMVEAVSGALIALDRENADFYRQNADDYIKELEELDNTFLEIISEAERDTIIFADRFAFRYFTEAYGLEYYASFPNCAEQAEPSALTMAFLIEKIKDEKIPAVFYGELSDKKIASTIVRETGAEALLLHSCHTVSQEELDGGIGYIELMRRNAEALRRALT